MKSASPKLADSLEATANAAETEIEDFQDLVNLRLCFQPGPSRFNVGLYPLGATDAASEIWIRRQERPAASMGAAAQGEMDGRGEVGGGLCVTLWHPWRSQAQRRGAQGERERMVGGLRAANSECFSKLRSYAWFSSISCVPHNLGSSGLLRGPDSLRFMHKI